MKKIKITAGGIVVILCCAVYFTSYLSRLDYGAVMAEMIASGILKKESAGMIGTSLFFTYGVGQLVSGYLGDKIRPEKLIACGLFVTALCNVLMPFTAEVALLCVIWGINGFAQALLWPPMVKLMSEYLSEKNYGRGVFCVSTASHIATILIYLFVPLCIALTGWKSVFWYAGGMAAAVLVFFVAVSCRLKKNASALKSSENIQAVSAEQSGFRNLFIFSGLILILAAIVLQGILRDGITSWMPTYMTEVFGMSAKTSILVNVLLPIFSWLCILLAGTLYKRVFKNEIKGALFFFAAALIFAVIFLVFKENAVVSVVSAALITGCMHAVNLLLICYVPMRFKKTGKVSLISGTTNAFTYVGSTISSYGFAVISVSLGWTFLIYIWIAACVLALIVLLFTLKPWKKFIG